MKRYILLSFDLLLVIIFGVIALRTERTDPRIIPGSPLYDFKVIVEDVWVALMPTAGGKVDSLISVANERLAEARKLVDSGESWRLYFAFRPMRLAIDIAEDVADSPLDTEERQDLSRQVAAAALSLQSSLYDLKAVTPDQNQDFAVFNINRMDAVAETALEKSYHGSHGPLAQANSTSAVLGITDSQTDPNALIAVAAIILMPISVFLIGLIRHKTGRKS